MSREFSYELARVIALETGIHHDQDRQYLLESRLSPLLKKLGIPSLENLGDILVRTHPGLEPWLSVYDAISTGESYFLRDRKGLDLIFSTILPDLAPSDLPQTILSAGCSSGEEIYTLAILRLLSGFPKPVNLEGVDLSPGQIRKAVEGRYDSRAVRFLERTIVDRYFDPAGNLYQVKDSVRDRIRFFQGNILSLSQDRPPGSVSGIVCRNVVIYFDESVRKKVINVFYHLLEAGGFLILGSGESLPDSGRPFRMDYHEGNAVYRKE
ncbi:MAG: CheR family methyltransferase [Leptospirales bacterium]